MTLSFQDELLLNAYLDGELDPIEAARFDQRLVADPLMLFRCQPNAGAAGVAHAVIFAGTKQHRSRLPLAERSRCPHHFRSR